MRDEQAPAAGCWTGPAGSTAFTGCGTIAAGSAVAITGPVAVLVVSTCPAASTRHAKRAVTTRGPLMEALCTLTAMRILGLWRPVLRVMVYPTGSQGIASSIYITGNGRARLSEIALRYTSSSLPAAIL